MRSRSGRTSLSTSPMETERHDTAATTRPAWAPIACAAGVTLVAVLWIGFTSSAVLRQHLRVGQFWFLEALLVTLLAVSGIAGRHVLRILDAPTKGILVILICAAAALVLVAPRTNRIFYDEQIYQAIGQNLSDLGLAQMCNDGTMEYGILQCSRHEYNKQPYGYPHLLSVGYRLFGTSELVAHRMNVFISGATAGVIFLLTLLLTRDRLAAVLAAVAFMQLPEQLRWSHSAAVEPSAAFVCSVAMLATAAFLTFRSTTALVWMAVATSWTASFRPEGILIVAVVAAVVVLYAREEVLRPRFLWSVALSLCLLVPAAAHFAAVGNESWGSTNGRFSLPFFWNNVQTNSIFYVADRRFPIAVTAFAIAGLAASRVTAILVTWFAAFWGVFLFFYAGSYNYGADVRFSLLSYPPLAVLAGNGMSRLVRAAAVKIGASRARGIAIAAVVLQFTW